MVTKITVDFPGRFQMQRKPFKGEESFQAGKKLGDIAKHLDKIARLIEYIDIYPDRSVESAIKLIFGSIMIHTSHYSKKKRVHSIWLCYIHEEDIEPAKTLKP